MTTPDAVKRVWLPYEGRALGVDWSGGKKAHKKVWSAGVEFSPTGCSLVTVGRPFAAGGPPTVSGGFASWLAGQSFDTAGFDFCFGLHSDHIKALNLPASGPAAVGAATQARWQTAEGFRQAVGQELKRKTDVTQAAPFAPTNLRMFRQTYWGLRAMLSVTEAVPPWSYNTGRTVAEVLPAQVAKLIAPGCSYKKKGGAAERTAMVAALKATCRMVVPEASEKILIDDKCGDAIDAVLAAVAAASSWASGFAGAPPAAATTGEGWIFGALPWPDRGPFIRKTRGAVFPRQVIAAHEAGHAVVSMAVGIPVEKVDAVPGPDGAVWTHSKDEEWEAGLRLLDGDPRFVRRVLGKAGGLAGEWLAGLFDGSDSDDGARRDVSMLGGALIRLGILSRDSRDTPKPLLAAAIIAAVEVLKQERLRFDSLRRELLERDSVVPQAFEPTWNEAKDLELLNSLRGGTNGSQ